MKRISTPNQEAGTVRRGRQGGGRAIAWAAAVAIGVTMQVEAQTRGAAKDGPTPEQARTWLAEGNERFVEGKRTRPNQTALHRNNVANSQRPFAVVVGCSDSRVVPEMVFDRGIGDLFVVRVAGQVVEPHALGSVEYAVKHLKTPLVVVLGHERCGAVRAAVEGKVNEGSIPGLAAAIKPAVDRVRDREGDLIDNAVREQVRSTVDRVKRDSPILGRGVKQKTLRVVGAYYDLDTGKVSFIQ